MDRIIPNGISILIVDDNYDDVIILSRYLKDYNVPVEVSSVHTGEEAIEKLKSHKYDLCIFDLNLPGIGGLDLIKHVAAHGDNLPTIMITGQGDEKKAVQAMKLGIYDYLVKDEIDSVLLNKTVCHAIDSHRNKTEKERMERELQAYTERLEEMVEERSRELSHKRRLAEMGEMAAHIAHDIRNPLNSLGLSHEILDRCPDIKGLDRESLKIMGKGIERLTSITNDLLDYGRNDKLNKESFVLLGVIDNLLSELGDKISKSGIEVVKKVPGESTTLNADKVKIRQALINVISNAIESMPEGGTLTLSMSEENGRLMVAVSDAGCGIPNEEIDNIFVPFFTTKKQGTGLGLAIVKHFIDLHSGDISVDSEVGRGTTITITLPL